MPGGPKGTKTVEVALVQVGKGPAKGRGAIKAVTGEPRAYGFRKPREHRFSQIKER